MRWDFPDKDIIPQDFRMLMRSRHIYILFSGVIHILLGLYLQMRPRRWQKVLQILGSLLLFTGSSILIAAFFYETYIEQHYSELSRAGLYTTLWGTFLHLLGGVWKKDAESEK